MLHLAGVGLEVELLWRFRAGIGTRDLHGPPLDTGIRVASGQPAAAALPCLPAIQAAVDENLREPHFEGPGFPVRGEGGFVVALLFQGDAQVAVGVGQLGGQHQGVPAAVEGVLAPTNADSAGLLPPWTFPTGCATTPGTYLVWVIDETTGRISNLVKETINPNPSCP